MTVESETIGAQDAPPAGSYAEICQFYAEHMYLLDSGAADEWAATFTEDGVFTPPSRGPVRGRAALAEGVRRTMAELAAVGETRRHLLSSFAVQPRADGSLVVRSYAQIVATRKAAEPRLLMMCVCDDVLVRRDGRLFVRERRVTRDDLP